MDTTSAPREDDSSRLLCGGDGVERDKIREENRACRSMAKSDSEKGGSKIPRLAHRPPRSHRPSSVASSSSTDTDHSAVKEEVAKSTKSMNKLDPALLLNAACLVAVNATKLDGKHSPVFSATDSALQLLSLRRKNRTKSDSCVTSARQGRKSMGHSRVKSDTSAIKTSKRRKTPRASAEGFSDLSSTSSDSSKFRVNQRVPSGSGTSDSLEFSDHALKKCRSSIGKDGDDEDTDDSTVIESPPSFLEVKKSLNSAAFKLEAHEAEKRRDSQEAIPTDTVACDVLVQENKSNPDNLCELEPTPSLGVTDGTEKVGTNPNTQKARSQDKITGDNLKRSFSSVETNTRSGHSSHCNVESAESSEDYYSCRSFCSIDPGNCPSMCTMQDVGKTARHDLKMSGNLQGMSPGEHRLRSMQLQSRVADMIKFGKSWLQTTPKGKATRNCKLCKAGIGEHEKGMSCRLSKSQSSVIGINPTIFDYSQKPNPFPRTIYFCKKKEADGNRTATSDASSENSYEEWYETSGLKAGKCEKSPSGQVTCRFVSTSFVDGPEIIPKEKLTKQELEQHSMQLDVVDRNTVGIQVNLYSVLEFQARFGVDIGIQVNNNDLELENISLYHKCEKSTSSISLKPKRSRLPICNKSKFTYDESVSINTGNSKIANLDENDVNSCVPKIDLSVLTGKESRTTQISLEAVGSKLSQVSLENKHSRTTQMPVVENEAQVLPEDLCSEDVEIPSHKNGEHGVSNDNITDDTLNLSAKSKETLGHKSFEVNVAQMEVEEFSPKCEDILLETNTGPSETISIQSQVKTEFSPKTNPSFRTSKKASPKLSPKKSPKVVTKQSPKPLTRFTNLKKSSKQEESARTAGPNTQAKSEHFVVAKKDSTPNTAKSDQGVSSTSQTSVFVKKTPKIPRRIPVPSKDKTGIIKEKIIANCTNYTRLTAGIDGVDTAAKADAASTRSSTEVGKNDRNLQKDKSSSSRIPRQDAVGVPKPKLPGSSRDTRCVACRSTVGECNHTGKFRSSVNNKTARKKPFSAA